MSLYLTAILPPEYLAGEINDIRIELSERYNIFGALKPPVHITLYRPVHMDEKLEKHLIKQLQPISSQHKPFMQELLNFDSFNIQTIYISAVKNALLSAMQKDVSAVFNKNKIDPKQVKGTSTFHPHITVAFRDVRPEVFPEIWGELKNRKFKRSFLIDSFSLLKHNGKKWEVLKDFPLQKANNLELF